MIVGFGHEARTGKDTAAQPLVDLGYKKVGFADALKALAFASNPLIRSGATVNVQIGHGRLAHIVSQLGWERAKDDVPEIRTYLQNLGVACREVFNEDFWIDQWEQQVKKANDTVVADVRFQNEFKAIRAIGRLPGIETVLIKIERPGYGAVAGSHVSELDLADAVWDHVVVNDGSIEQLHKKILAIVAPPVAKAA